MTFFEEDFFSDPRGDFFGDDEDFLSFDDDDDECFLSLDEDDECFLSLELEDDDGRLSLVLDDDLEETFGDREELDGGSSLMKEENFDFCESDFGGVFDRCTSNFGVFCSFSLSFAALSLSSFF